MQILLQCTNCCMWIKKGFRITTMISASTHPSHLPSFLAAQPCSVLSIFPLIPGRTREGQGSVLLDKCLATRDTPWDWSDFFVSFLKRYLLPPAGKTQINKAWFCRKGKVSLQNLHLLADVDFWTLPTSGQPSFCWSQLLIHPGGNLSLDFF